MFRWLALHPALACYSPSACRIVAAQVLGNNCAWLQGERGHRQLRLLRLFTQEFPYSVQQGDLRKKWMAREHPDDLPATRGRDSINATTIPFRERRTSR